MGVETEHTFYHGSNRDVDTSAEVLTSTSVQCQHGVTITADNTNDGVVFVGNSSAVTAGSADATDGAPIFPGLWRFFPVRDPSKLYVIADTANQVVYWDCN